VSEPRPKTASESSKTIIFMVLLSFFCALLLSSLASILAKPKEIAKDLDRSKQLMIAAKILDHSGYFLMTDSKGETIPAKYSKGGVLVPGTENDLATNAQLIEIYEKRVKPILVNSKGDISTFEEQKINLDEYLAEYKKMGYYKAPWKLVYKIMPNSAPDAKNQKPDGYVIPVSGNGLWNAIYGYLALKPDGDTVTGISWYEHQETPGLGGNIAEPEWQSLFPGKKIFQESPGGKTDFKTASLGLIVVKGKVDEVLGSSPKAKSAVDGMTGATLTGNGVTDAYRDVLAPYRPFLLKIQEEYSKNQK
jgi:Na+-transporting NADH:ubiquinone oxidoreductase subunit C